MPKLSLSWGLAWAILIALGFDALVALVVFVVWRLCT